MSTNCKACAIVRKRGGGGAACGCMACADFSLEKAVAHPQHPCSLPSLFLSPAPLHREEGGLQMVAQQCKHVEGKRK